MLPDRKAGFIRHADAGQLQRQQNLAAMVRVMSDEVAEQLSELLSTFGL
jgi:hypothetical protein